MNQIERVCALSLNYVVMKMPEVILNNLFVQTQLQVVFGINIVALDRWPTAA